MRLAPLPAAGTLALYAALAAFEATRLPHVGAWTMILPKQNQCLAGNGLRCYELAAEGERYPASERQAFARRGYESGYDGACQQLTSFLGSTHAAGRMEMLALAGRCEAGNPDVRERL